MDGRKKYFSEERKQKIRERMLGINNPFYGKKHTKESIRKMRELKLGEKNVRFGVHLSDKIKK